MASTSSATLWTALRVPRGCTSTRRCTWAAARAARVERLPPSLAEAAAEAAALLVHQSPACLQVDSNFFDGFEDDFDESDMKPAGK